MRQPSPIADYLDALDHALAFDPALARRVRKEAADHLREVAANASGGVSEAERHAVAAFGDPRALARQYAASSLLAQTRRVGAVTILALAGIYLAMKGRVAWYGVTQWSASDALKNMNAIALPLDRYAFMLALVLAIVAWAYIGSRRAPCEFDRACGREAQRCAILSAAAAVALLVSVATEAVLTTVRLLAAAPGAMALVPALTMAAETAFAGALLVQIRAAIRRAAIASSLLGHERDCGRTTTTRASRG